jgi:hypothetical protein
MKRGRGDASLRAIKTALRSYVNDYPGAVAEAYRYNAASIRIRVVDERFAKQPFDRRHDELWEFLNDRIPDEVMSEISFLIPVTPAERERDLSSVEFDHPTHTLT